MQAIFSQLSRFISAVLDSNAVCYSVYSDVFFQFHLNSTAVYGCFDIRVITFNLNSFTKRFLHGLTVFRFKAKAFSFKTFNSIMQLATVYSVFAIFCNRTVSYVSNLLACCIDAVLRHRWTIGNLHAVFCNSCQRITCCIFNSHTFAVYNGFTICTISSIVESNGVQVFKVFCQTNIEDIIFTDNANIVFSQIIFVCYAALNVQLFIKFFLNHITGVTTVCHTIILGCHLMCLTIFISVFNTSDFVTVEVRITFFNRNVSATAVFTVESDVTYAVFTRNRYSFFAILTSNSYLAVCTVVRTCNGHAVLTVFANLHGFSLKVFIHLHIDSCITRCWILCDESFKVFTAVIIVICSAFTFNSHFGAKLVSFFAALVSIEFQTFISQCIRTIFDFVIQVVHINRFATIVSCSICHIRYVSATLFVVICRTFVSYLRFIKITCRIQIILNSAVIQFIKFRFRSNVFDGNGFCFIWMILILYSQRYIAVRIHSVVPIGACRLIFDQTIISGVSTLSIQRFFQLIFCCGTTGYDLVCIPIFIIKACYIIACFAVASCVVNSLTTHSSTACFHSLSRRYGIKIFKVFRQLKFQFVSAISFYVDIAGCTLERCRFRFSYAFTLYFH